MLGTRTSPQGFAVTAPTLAGSPRLRDWLTRAVQLVQAWQERARQRRHLSELSDTMLKDLGLTRADVMIESSKPFWRL